MGILILGAMLAIAVGMGIGTFAAYKLGVHEGIGQVAGVALVGLAAVLWLKADDRKRAQATPPPAATVTVVDAAHGSGGSTDAAVAAPAPSETLLADASSAQATEPTATGLSLAEADATAAGEATTDEDGSSVGSDGPQGSVWASLHAGAGGHAFAVAETPAGESNPTSFHPGSAGLVSAFD